MCKGFQLVRFKSVHCQIKSIRYEKLKVVEVFVCSSRSLWEFPLQTWKNVQTWWRQQAWLCVSGTVRVSNQRQWVWPREYVSPADLGRCSHVIVSYALCRCVGPTTKRTTRRVFSSPPNATWRAPRKVTGSIWTTRGRANVSADHAADVWVKQRPLHLITVPVILPRSDTSVCGHGAGPVPSANEGLAEKCAAAALWAWLHVPGLPHSKTTLQSKIPPSAFLYFWIDNQLNVQPYLSQVQKIFESERRLHAGDHSVELLAQDFEKNYNMYIYPVHWQFAQLDQHPSDRWVFFCYSIHKMF